MATQDGGSEWKTSTRGEQAWKEATEAVASRNAEARKAGKIEREAYDRRRQTARHAAAVKRDAGLQGRRTR